MDSKLPEIKKENIFSRIKNWFSGLFKSNIIENTNSSDFVDEEIKKEIEEIKNANFKEKIKVESKDKILALQRKLKEKQIEIADLTDEQLDEMIKLYSEQIEMKKEKLKQYRKNMKKN